MFDLQTFENYIDNNEAVIEMKRIGRKVRISFFERAVKTVGILVKALLIFLILLLFLTVLYSGDKSILPIIFFLGIFLHKVTKFFSRKVIQGDFYMHDIASPYFIICLRTFCYNNKTTD